MTPNQDHYYIAELLRKYFNEDISDDECELLKNWVAESEINQNFLNQLKGDETIQSGVDFLANLDYKEGWKSVKRKRRIKGFKKLIPYLSTAAVLFICIGVGIYFFKSYSIKENAKEIGTTPISNDFLPASSTAQLELSDGRVIDLDKQSFEIAETNGINISGRNGELIYNSAKQSNSLIYNTIVVPKKGFFKLTLSDGTKVWLNSYTRLYYPVSFGKQKRNIKLTGEAYFEVKKDATRPFIVEVSGKSIQVLGTKFNVNAYQPIAKTTLLEGSVKIAISHKSKMLIPGQEAIFSKDEIAIRPADTQKVLAWKNGEFFFRKDGIKEIMEEVSRWYDVEILYNGDNYGKEFSGSLSRSLTLPQVLEMLHFLSGHKFKLTGRTVTVS
jgi:transmembrane sensor